jgi:hypothetical protein
LGVSIFAGTAQRGGEPEIIDDDVAQSLKRVKTANDDQKHGIEIVKKAITWPARQIAINSGEDGSIVVGKILENDSYAYGFDAQTGEFGNLVSKGIIDPTKVVRIALQDASSIAFGPPSSRSYRAVLSDGKNGARFQFSIPFVSVNTASGNRAFGV